MSKRLRSFMSSWDKYWLNKERTGMVEDHYNLANMDLLLSDFEIEYSMNKKAGKLDKGFKRLTGRLGRKCHR